MSSFQQLYPHKHKIARCSNPANQKGLGVPLAKLIESAQLLTKDNEAVAQIRRTKIHRIDGGPGAWVISHRNSLFH